MGAAPLSEEHLDLPRRQLAHRDALRLQPPGQMGQQPQLVHQRLPREPPPDKLVLEPAGYVFQWTGDEHTASLDAPLDIDPTLSIGESLADEDAERVKSYFLLTSKPVIYACNVSEDDLAAGTNAYVEAVAEFAHAAIDAVPTSRLQLFITTSTNLINKWVNDLTDKVPA